MTLADHHTLRAISDLLVNLSAGWYGATVIGTSVADLASLGTIFGLATNMFFGTIMIVLAIRIRRSIALP